MKTLRLFAFLCIIFGFTANNAKAQFFEDFSSTNLDPAWTVVQTWPGGTPRAYGYTLPGNRYSLTANSGYLRYWLDEMTHMDGFLNSYQTTYGFHSCCIHDAGLEIQRTFSGDKWSFEAGGIFHLPAYANGRGFIVRLYFGTGEGPTYWVQIYRGADVHWNSVTINLYEKTGPELGDNTMLEDYQPIGPWSYGEYNYPTAPQFYRVKRAEGRLTAYWSDDGIT
jgi:hypothetical protein